jgi:hypothetical protein
MDFEIVEVPDTQTVVVTEEQPAELISEGVLGPPGQTGEKGDKGDKGDRGADGAHGDPGPNEIGGFAVALSNPVIGDLLALGDNKWTNISAPNLTDGGNF